MKIALVVNPWAGIGGAVALKGSDGAEVRAKALALGAEQKAMLKTGLMLQHFLKQCQKADRCQWFSCPGEMGGALLEQHGISFQCSPTELPEQTESTDTRAAVQWFLTQGVDLIVFAGGDGTARDVYAASEGKVPVLGIPAGVKIHSGVFAVTPHAAGEVLAGLVDGRLTERHLEEVRDIDEQAFRENRVQSKFYGEMPVPVAGEFMQHVKVGGIENEELVLSDIADWLSETLEEDVCYFVGSGKTIATLMAHLNLPNTLLGVDAILNGELIKRDCTAQDLLGLLSQYRCKAIQSIIGGQGHILGRGNAQFSPEVLAQLPKDDFLIVGTKAKIKALEGRPLLVDTSDPDLDRQWAGLITVITGYNDQLIYPVEAL